MSWVRVPRRPSEVLRSALGWTAFWAGFAAIDEWRNYRHDGTTFSQTIRDLFNVETPAGRRNFLYALGLAHGIFAAHILKKKA